MKIDGEVVVREALRSMREADRPIRARRRGEAESAAATRSAAPASEPAAAPTNRGNRGMQPPAGLGEAIVSAALRARRELTQVAARSRAAEATPASEVDREALAKATVPLRSELGDEIFNFAKQSGIEVSNGEIGEATLGLQMQIKTVAAEVRGIDAIADALGGVFDEFLSGLRGLLGFAVDALRGDEVASPTEAPAAAEGEADAPTPSTVAPDFNIAVPASELPTPAAPAAASEPAQGDGTGSAFAIDPLPVDAVAATTGSEPVVVADEVDVDEARTDALEGLFDRLRERFAAFQAAFFSSGSPIGVQVYSETLNLSLNADDGREVDTSA